MGGATARHPVMTLLVTAIIVVISMLGVFSLRVSSSLADMFGSDNPASLAMIRVAEEYHTSDELFLLVSLHEGASLGPPQTALLTDFAKRLIGAIEREPSTARMIASVRYQQDPAYYSFAQEVMLPAAAYYLSDEGFKELLVRLTPEGMQKQLRRAEALLSSPGPAPSAIAHAVLRDPLRIAELVEAKRSIPMMDIEGTRAVEGSAELPAELSHDGQTLLIRIAGVHQVNDLPFSQKLTDRIQTLAQRVNRHGLRVELAGGYAIATTTARGIRADSIQSVMITGVILIVLFILVYRGLLIPLLIVGMTGVGILVGIGAQGLREPLITPLGAAIAAMLAGLGIDYGIHFIAHYQYERTRSSESVQASINALESIGKALLANCLSTIFGFGVLIVSSVAMLRSFSAISVSALLGCLLAVVLVIPAMCRLLDRNTALNPSVARFERPIAKIASRPRACLMLGLAVFGTLAMIILTKGPTPVMETDLSVMHSKPNRAFELSNELAGRFGDAGETLPVEISAETSDAMVAAAHRVAHALEGAEGQALGITRVLGVSMLLPDPSEAEHRNRVLASINADRVRSDFEAAVRESAFNETAFDGYAEQLRSLVLAAPPNISTLLQFPTIASRLFPSTNADLPSTRTLLAVQLDSPLTDRVRRDRVILGVRDLLHEVPQATLTGMSAVAYDLEIITLRDLPRLAWLAFALILGCLLIFMRRLSHVVMALIPLVFAVLSTMSVIAAFDLRLNAINGIALPLLFGITVDAGVFLVIGAAQSKPGQLKELCPTIVAVITASITTLAGFFPLCFASTPAIQSLGILACAGVTGGILGVLLVLVPILVLSHRL